MTDEQLETILGSARRLKPFAIDDPEQKAAIADVKRDIGILINAIRDGSTVELETTKAERAGLWQDYYATERPVRNCTEPHTKGAAMPVAYVVAAFSDYYEGNFIICVCDTVEHAQERAEHRASKGGVSTGSLVVEEWVGDGRKDCHRRWFWRDGGWVEVKR